MRTNLNTLEKVTPLLCDIESYRGFVHFTSVGNIESILSKGLLQTGSLKNLKRGIYGWGGSYIPKRKIHMRMASIFLSWADSQDRYNPASFSKFNIEYCYGGPLCLLFNEEYLPAPNLLENAGIGTIVYDPKGIQREAIKGIVLSPSPSFILKYPQREPLEVSRDKVKMFTINRLNRLVRREENVVPLYDNTGDLLWPEEIPHQKFKHL